MSQHNSHVHILGTYANINVAKDAVVKLILGNDVMVVDGSICNGCLNHSSLLCCVVMFMMNECKIKQEVHLAKCTLK